MKPFVEQLNTNGYAIVRGFLSAGEIADISSEVDRVYAAGLKHHATYRDRNLLFEILDDPKARRRVVLQAHWTAWISPLMETMRRSAKYFDVLRRAGLDSSKAVVCEMEPGDLLLWNLFTVHGSAPNVSSYDRRFMINSYVRARDSEHGEWAFRCGISTPLGAEPQICKYEQLHEKPGPFYIESDWTEEAVSAARK